MSLETQSAFPEEPLNLTREQGFGFFPAYPRLTLKNGRYEVVRKLGRGRYSSTWLVADTENVEKKYSAVKILTAYATQGHRDGHLRELEFLKAVRDLDNNDYLPIMLDYFEHEGPHGDHLCLVLELLSGDVSSFRRSAPSKTLAVHVVKLIIAHVLEALEELHGANIIHTDVKADNFLFNVGSDTAHIEKIVAATPPAIDGQFDLHGTRYSIVRSQPIPHHFRWDDNRMIAELYTICLADLGHGQWSNKAPTTQTITPYSPRAPEVILGAGFDTKVDIWALGCVTFELLTGRWLFNPEEGEGWTVEDDHLAKMLELTGGMFGAEMLARSRLRDNYFDGAGKLRRIDDLFPLGLEEAIANYKVLAAGDIAPAAAFIRACLCLDPTERASASQLILHEWIKGAFTCADYQKPGN